MRHTAALCAPRYAQCGGKGFNGPTCCDEMDGDLAGGAGSLHCFVNNDWHSQCLDTCPSGWACAAGSSSSSSSSSSRAREDNRESKTHVDETFRAGSGSESVESVSGSTSGIASSVDALLASSTAAQQAISKFAGNAAQELKWRRTMTRSFATACQCFLVPWRRFLLWLASRSIACGARAVASGRHV